MLCWCCSGHVLTEDITSQNVKTGHLYTKRLLTKTNHLPRWGERFVPGPRHVCIIEESVIDPKTQTLTTYTRNIGYTTIMVITPTCFFFLAFLHFLYSVLQWSLYLCSRYQVFCRRITGNDSLLMHLSRVVIQYTTKFFLLNCCQILTHFQYFLAGTVSVACFFNWQCIAMSHAFVNWSSVHNTLSRLLIDYSLFIITLLNTCWVAFCHCLPWLA